MNTLQRFLLCAALTLGVAAPAQQIVNNLTVQTKVLNANGSVAVPSYSFTNSPTTGLIRSSADALGIVTGGVERWVVNSSGAFNPILDNTYDIGNGTVNPRDVHVSRDLIFKNTGEGATFHGGGTLTGASGALTMTASGADKDITLTPSGTGFIDTAAGIRARGQPTFTGGAALELSYDGARALVRGYNRTGSTYMPMRVDGSTVELQISGVNALEFDASKNATFAGTISAITTGTITRTGLGTTSADGLIVQNTTDAAAGAQQLGPRIGSWGEGWKTDATAATVVVGMGFETLPVEGAAAPTATMRFFSKIGAGAVTYPMTLTSAGVLTTLGGINTSADAGTGGAVTIPAGATYTWLNRARLHSSADAKVRISDTTSVTGITLDASTDGTLKVRNFADSADAAITAGAATLSGALIGTPDARSGPGAVSVTALSTEVTSTGVNDALTLAAGTNGQIKTIVHGVDGGSFVLTPATATGWSTFTSTAAGESITLQFFTTRGWIVLSSYLGTVAP